MKNHSYLLDHHQRSHWDTITIGLEGMMNWVLQLNNSQSVNSFNSLVEKFNMQSSPNQPNQNPNQSVIDRGNLRTQKMCLLLKVKRPVPTRSMKKVCTKNLVLQIDRGNLINCLNTSVLSMLTMEQGNLLSKTAQVHTHSEWTICSWRKSWHCVIQRGQRVQPCNQRGEHWLQHSRITTFCSETITWRQRSKFDSEDRDNSILSAKNHETWLKQLETLNCVNYSMLNLKHSAKYVCHTGTSASSTARAVTSCEMIRKRTRSTLSSLLTSIRFPSTTSGKVDPTVTATGRKKGITSTSSRISSRRNARRENSWASYTTLLKNKLVCTATISGSVRILLVPTRCPWGIELMSKKHCLPCDASRIKRIKLITKIGGKALPHLGGTGKILGGILHLSITATMDPALIDRENLLNSDWANYSWNDSQN